MKKDFIGSASLDLYTMATGPVKHVVALTDASMRRASCVIVVVHSQPTLTPVVRPCQIDSLASWS